jgi:hypothetical protein
MNALDDRESPLNDRLHEEGAVLLQRKDPEYALVIVLITLSLLFALSMGIFGGIELFG